jgi:hypothetical protein
MMTRMTSRVPLADAVAPFLHVRSAPRLTRDPLNETAIRYFCEVVEDANPVYWDAEFARGSRYGRIIAPPQALWSLTFQSFWTPDYIQERNRSDADALGSAQSSGPGGPSAEDSNAMRIVNAYGYTTATVVDMETEYLSPFGPGDGRIVSRASTTSVSEPKNTRVGEAVFVTLLNEYSVEAGDRPIARQSTTIMMYRPAGATE